MSNGAVQIERKIPGPMGANVSLRTEQNGSAITHTVIYAHGDERGNRVFTGDDEIVQTVSYGTFGQTTTTSNGAPITQSDDLWNGGDNLPEVGVVILGPRAYDPELGRFLQRDPIRVALRSSMANPYAFAFSDPVNFSDPTGLSPCGGYGHNVSVSVCGGGGGGGGSSGVPQILGTVAFGAGALLLGIDPRSPLNPQNAVGADAYTGTGIARRNYGQNLCTGACLWGRTAYSTVDKAYSTYGSYLEGQVDGLYDTVAEIADGAYEGAKCTTQGGYCIYKKVRGAPDAVRGVISTVRSLPTFVEAVAQDPVGAMCGADGCSAHEIGRIEMKAKIAIASSVAGGGPQKVRDLARWLHRVARGKASLCFAAGTAVLTPDGLRPIEDIVVGDLVWSTNEENGEGAWKPVVRLFVTPSQGLLKVDLLAPNGDVKSLRVTAEHPLWTPIGWQAIGGIAVGGHVWSREGWLKILAVASDGLETVYNIEVEAFHTYHVGDFGVLVHNTCVDVARTISKGLPSANCDNECFRHADALISELKSRGIKGMELVVDPGTKVVFSDAHGALGTHGMPHRAVRVGDTVFDNMRPGGIPYADWVSDLGGPTFLRPPFSHFTETPF